MKYFAYGSNMNPKRLSDRGVKFKTREAAKLLCYKLAFNKKAYSGDFTYANIVKSGNIDLVEGVIYELDEKDLKELDGFEGAPSHYERFEIEILDSRNEKIKAIAYIARPDKIVNGLKPKKEYLNHILAGKDLLSKEYYDNLLLTETYD